MAEKAAAPATAPTVNDATNIGTNTAKFTWVAVTDAEEYVITTTNGGGPYTKFYNDRTITLTGLSSAT